MHSRTPVARTFPMSAPRSRRSRPRSTRSRQGPGTAGSRPRDTGLGDGVLRGVGLTLDGLARLLARATGTAEFPLAETVFAVGRFRHAARREPMPQPAAPAGRRA
jgi:hypothetical protein